VFALRIASHLLVFVRTIVLAHLLTPHHFGLFGIVLLVDSALDSLSQTGVQAALIQTKADVKQYLDTAWTLQLMRALGLGATIFALAPYVAAFFGESGAVQLLRVLGISALLRGFVNIGVVYFQKELEFQRQFVFSISGSLMDFGVAVVTALLLRNEWALVLGLIAGDLIRVVVSYWAHPYRPKLRLAWKRGRDLLGFGKWVFASSVLLFLITEGDDVVVGKLLGATALGLYQLAYRVSNMPATEIARVISQVTFPAYSKLQDNIQKLKDVYTKVLQLTALASIPLAGGILALGAEFVQLLLGQRWMPMLSTMQVLTLWGVIRSLGATMGPLLQAAGRPDILAKLGVVRVVCLAGLIYPLSMTGGIEGAALAVLISALLTMPITSFITVNKVLGGSVADVFTRALLIPLVSTLLMVLLLRFVSGQCTSLPGLAFLVFLGGSLYVALVCLLDRFLRYGTIDTLRQILVGATA
jgi:lipopolysaccharide exporter